jgi:hypothetical protein
MEKLKIWVKMNKIPLILLFTPIVIILGYVVYLIIIFTVINYSDRHQFDLSKEEISKLQPLSTRGLPVPATDVPVVLPPDPGEVGKLTLAGIDSNNDGVRDDLEREIVYMYPQNNEVRRVLRAMVKKEQQLITTTGDKNYFEGLMLSNLALRNCFEFLAYGNNIKDRINRDILDAMVINTKQRAEKAILNGNTALPYSSPIYFSSEACTQPLVKGQY